MKITWYGQASFGIEADTGLRIVTDPYDPETSGFKPVPDAADIVVMSSDNDTFHCNEHLVPKRDGAAVVNALTVAQSGGSTETHGMTIHAIQAMEHVDHHRHDPDQNGMYRFTLDGISIGHMGDMGNPFSEAQMKFFSGVDILLSHAGGFPVISLDELDRIVATVKPKLVIPMHFRTLCYKPQEMHFITEFLKHFPDDKTDFACASTTEISKSDLSGTGRALVLDYL